MTLDGTLWVEDGVPYMVFCHEWVQIKDGTVEYVRLKDDLSATDRRAQAALPRQRCRLEQEIRPVWLPCDRRTVSPSKSGKLFMIWTSGGYTGYTTGIAISDSGKLAGPWKQQAEPVYAKDGGHAMLFTTFDGKLMMVLHSPNGPSAQPRIFEMEDTGDTLRIKSEFTGENPRALLVTQRLVGSETPRRCFVGWSSARTGDCEGGELCVQIGTPEAQSLRGCGERQPILLPQHMEDVLALATRPDLSERQRRQLVQGQHLDAGAARVVPISWEREVAQRHRVTAEDDSALAGMFQLAHVARPGVPVESGQSLCLDALRPHPVLPAGEIDEVGRKQRDIALALTQRRNVDHQARETEVDILTEATLTDGSSRFWLVAAITRTSTVRSRVSPTRRDPPVLQHPKKACLELHSPCRRSRRGAAHRCRPPRTGLAWPSARR